MGKKGGKSKPSGAKGNKDEDIEDKNVDDAIELLDDAEIADGDVGQDWDSSYGNDAKSSAEDELPPPRDINAALKGFSKAFKTSIQSTVEPTPDKTKIEIEKTRKIKRASESRTRRISPLEACQATEERYKKIAKKGVEKLFKLLNQS